MTGAAIVCRNLTKRFGGLTAVDCLSLEVARGTICAFFGPNGAGKSTTVRMLTGLARPDEGEISVCGLDVVRDRIAVKRLMGVLPENLGLFDDLTVEEHLRLTGRIYGLGAKVARERSEQLLRVLDLEHGRETFGARCSHGMRKKTAFAMALLPNPEVLFLDEPFEAIDPVTAKTMGELLAAAAARGTTVFLTSHILSAAERIAGHFVMIRSGKVVWNSTAAELPRPLEELYFELAEPPAAEDVAWLGLARS